MRQVSWDVIIIGAGPAGLMAAIPCATGGLRTLILDSQPTIGAKLLISGGGRCNVTNVEVTENDYQSGAPRTVRNILRAFPPERTLTFFKEIGVEMVLEEGTKYFPREQSAKFLLQALLQISCRVGVIIQTGKKVKSVSKDDQIFHVSGEGFEHTARTLVIATGGLSYPGTGSDGSGYVLAKSLGHKITSTTPALTSLITDDAEWKTLAGITLPVGLSILADGKKIAQSKGALLFTHTGFSGPAALDISGPWLRTDAREKNLSVNFLPDRRESDLPAEWTRWNEEYPDRGWKRLLTLYFPERLAEVLLKKAGIDPQSRFDQISRIERESLIRLLFNFPLRVSGAHGFEKAEVTSGGVNLEKVDPKTLESTVCPRLFFAGEVLDVDGRIGGFNFQWAWASGTVVGRTIAEGSSSNQA
ncbi:MAG: NAD(P)/FAD-dependent oxidoreductase [Candidatus Omnitrophota bacterium]